MSIRLEAWTLPADVSFDRVVQKIPYEGLQIQPRWNGVGTGSFTVPYGYDRLSDILDPANNTETLIRVFDGETNIYSFFARSSAIEWGQSVTISGPGIESVLDHALIYPFDWAGSDVFPASQTTGVSTFLDTVYGGDNILANPGFEGGLLNEVQGISHDYRTATTLNGAITDVQTSLTVTDGSLLPAADFRIEIGNEWIHVTTRTGNSLTGLTRGYLGTTATAHSDLDPVTGGGWFTLTYNAQTTGRLEWNATANEIEFQLQALSNIIDVDVSGEGTVNEDPWLIEFIDPGEIDNPMLTATITNLDLGNGTQFNIVEKSRGGTGDPAPWTKSYDPNTLFVHGGYNVFNVGSASKFGDPAHTGDKALGIDPEVPTPQGEDNYPGAQQIVPVQPAGIYQASVWVYPTAAGMDFSLVIRDLNEKLIRKIVAVDLPINTWTQISTDNISIPVNVNQILFRVAANNPNDAETFWIDDAEFNEGYKPATVGQIITDMRTFATAQSRDTIDYIDTSSFDGTNDSASVAWNQVVSVYLSSGSSWRQVMDEFVRQGYEWRIQWNGSAYALDVYNPGGMGQTITGEAFTTARISSAFGRLRSPTHNVLLGEGGNQVVAESSDAALIAAYGRREGFQSEQDALDIATLTAALDHSLDERRAEKTTAKLTLDDQYKLGIDFELGDTITAEVVPYVPNAQYRISGALLTVDSAGNVIRTVDIGKYVFPLVKGTTSSVTSDAVNWLLRQKRKIQRLEQVTAEIANAVPNPQEYSTGGGIPWLVAASTAPQSVKDVAGYVCDGTNDEVEIQAALDTHGHAKLTPGFFYVEPQFAGGSAIYVQFGETLEGSGAEATFIYCEGFTGTTADWLIRATTQATVQHLQVDGRSNFVGSGIFTEYAQIQDVVVRRGGFSGQMNYGIYNNGTSFYQPIMRCRVVGRFTTSMFVNEGQTHLIGVLLDNTVGDALHIDTSSTIRNVAVGCTFSADNGQGVVLNGGGWTFAGCQIRGYNGGVYNTSSIGFDTTFVGCHIYGFFSAFHIGGGLDEFNISGCWIEGGAATGACIYLPDVSTQLTHGVIDGNYFSAGPKGIYSLAFVDEVIISNNFFNGPDEEAIRLEDIPRRVKIIGNHIFDACSVSGAAAIYVDSVNNTLHRGLDIIDNSIDACIGDGIHVLNTEHINVQGNRLLRVRGHQYRFDNCDQGIVSNNYADPDTNALTPSDGILLEGDTNELLISGNKLVPDIDAANSRYGINVSAATCDANVVVHNDLRPGADWATATLNDAGTGTSTDATPADATAGDNWV